MAGKDKKFQSQSPRLPKSFSAMTAATIAAPALATMTKSTGEAENIGALDIKVLLQDLKTGQEKLEQGQQKLDSGQEAMHAELQKLAEQHKKLEKKVLTSEKELKETEKRVDVNEMKIQALTSQQEEMFDKMAMMEMKVKDSWLCLRGLPESEGKADLRGYLANMFAEMLDEKDVEAINESMVSMYRLNSRFAKAHNVPRDCIIKFSAKPYKDLILSKHHDNPITVEGRKILLMKEIPLRISRKRKDFTSLVDVLKKNNISFRWLFPQGVSFYYKARQIILNVDRAKQFLCKHGEKLGYTEEAMEDQEALTSQQHEDEEPSASQGKRRRTRRSTD